MQMTVLVSRINGTYDDEVKYRVCTERFNPSIYYDAGDQEI